MTGEGDSYPGFYASTRATGARSDDLEIASGEEGTRNDEPGEGMPIRSSNDK